MEEQRQNESFDAFLSNALDSESNCILIGENHDKCPALLPVINFLLSHEELCRTKKIAIFYETYFALGENNLSPYSLYAISNLPEEKNVIDLLKSLVNCNVDLYGLETPQSDPFIRFKDKDYQVNEKSIDELSAILQDHHLEKAFIEKHGKNIQDLISMTNFSTGWRLAAGVYGESDLRIRLPNEIFCELINSNDSNLIRIVIVGNAHIPEVHKIEANTLIDDGMANRLNKQNHIQNLAVTTITNDPYLTAQPYIIKEEGNIYSAIRNVCFIDSQQVNANLRRLVRQYSPKNPRLWQDRPIQGSQPFQESDETMALVQRSTNKSRYCKCCKFF